jgi:cytochrome P450
MDAKTCPVHFDHNSPEHSHDDLMKIYGELRATSPVAWTESNGGYWIVSTYDEVTQVTKDPETYSSALTTDDEGSPHGGIFIPAEKGLVAMIPTEIDAPLWNDFRRLLAPEFSPATVKAMLPMIKDVTTRYVDKVVEAGECDLALDIAAAIPAAVMLTLMDLDPDGWNAWAEPFHDALGYPPGTPEFDHALEGLYEIVARITTLVAERQKNPGDDLISKVVCAEIDGERITDDAAISVVYTLFSGGVDTTTSFLVNAFAHLSRNPDAKQFLIDDLSRIRVATEEYMRWAAPVQALARTVTRPTTLGGQQLAVGDRVLLSWTSANRDEKVFDRVDEVVLDRFPNKHVAWGQGLHRCVGAHMARAMIDIILTEVLTRIPDFKIDEERSRQYPNIGIVNGWAVMPATFTPAPVSVA